MLTTLTAAQMTTQVVNELGLTPTEVGVKIKDMIDVVCNYCNLSTEMIPVELEPFIRRKVESLLDYEEACGTGYRQEISSMTEGDSSVTFATDSSSTKDNIYGISTRDTQFLRKFRRLSRYA